MRINVFVFVYQLLLLALLCSHAAAKFLVQESLLTPRCSLGHDDDESFVELENPEMFAGEIGSMIVRVGCVRKRAKMVTIVGPNGEDSSLPIPLPPCSQFFQRNETMVMYYLSRDLCRMGHSTKDPPYLMTFLLDYFAPCAPECRKKWGDGGAARIRVQLSIIYGNICFSTIPDSRSSRDVILGWFHSVFQRDSPFMALMTSWGIDFVTDTQPSHDRQLAVQEIFYKDIPAQTHFYCPGVMRPRNTFTPVANSTSVRSGKGVHIIQPRMRFRWFRTRRQASLFRKCLLQYYGVRNHAEEVPTSFLILRRLSGRHFEESKWFKWLQLEMRSCGASVTLQSFELLSYRQQLSLMHNTSIFIAAHGAGIVNIMGMRPGGVVVELFPCGFRYAMYQELAELLQLNYISYEAHAVWPENCCKLLRKNSPIGFMPSLENVNSTRSFGSTRCKDCNIKISENRMGTIVRNALAFVAANRALHIN